MGGNVADATLLGQTPLPMRSWFPPFAKCAKDGADLVIGGDSRSKAGASAIPPPHQDQNPRPVSAKNADTRTGHPPPKTDAGGKSQADAGGGGTGQGGRDAAGHDSVVGHRPGTRLRRSGRRGGGGRNCSAGVAGGGLFRRRFGRPLLGKREKGRTPSTPSYFGPCQRQTWVMVPR